MLSTEVAGLAIKIARALIKIISRIDVILAEQAAAQDPRTVPIAELSSPPAQPRMRRTLCMRLNDTEEQPHSE